MAFEYEDNDLGLEDEELEEEDSPEEQLRRSIANLIVDDEEETGFDEDEDVSLDELQNNIDSLDTGEEDDDEESKADTDSGDDEGSTSGDQKSNTSKNSKPDGPDKQKGGNGLTQRLDMLKSKFSKGGGGAAKNVGKDAAAKATKEVGKKAGAAIAKFIASNPYVLIVIGIILLILILIMVIAGVAGAIQEQENSGTLTFGTITNEYFYGMRLAYVDEQVLTNELQLSYKQYAVDMLQIIDDHAEADITITLPEEFDNATAIDQNIVNISIAIGNIVATGSSEYENVEFASLYSNIPYFGLDETQLDLVISFISSYISSNGIVTIADGSTITIEELVNIAKENEGTQYITNLCEKVIIQDVLATEEEIASFGSHKFIGAVYMPHSAVTISEMSYLVKYDEGVEVSLELINRTNGSESTLITFNQSEGDYCEVDDNLEITLSPFTNINTNDTSVYSNGISLFAAIKSKNTTLAQVDNIFTWTPTDENALYLKFTSNEAFQFNELYIVCENPNG